MTQDPVLRDLLDRRDALDAQRAPFESVQDVRDQITRELAGLATVMLSPRAEHSWPAIRQRLIGVMATYYRGYRDLNIESAAAAIEAACLEIQRRDVAAKAQATTLEQLRASAHANYRQHADAIKARQRARRQRSLSDYDAEEAA